MKVTPQDIDRIVQTLKNFSGANEEKDVLEDIDWVEGKRHPVYSTVRLEFINSYLECVLYPVEI